MTKNKLNEAITRARAEGITDIFELQALAKSIGIAGRMVDRGNGMKPVEYIAFDPGTRERG